VRSAHNSPAWVTALLTAEGVRVTPDVKDAVWTALQSLASAPKAERTLTGLAVLIQSSELVAALAPYTLEGAYGRLLDGSAERLATSDVLHFESCPTRIFLPNDNPLVAAAPAMQGAR
jgi:type IV secretory pathway VirB4 component